MLDAKCHLENAGTQVHIVPGTNLKPFFNSVFKFS